MHFNDHLGMVSLAIGTDRLFVYNNQCFPNYSTIHRYLPLLLNCMYKNHRLGKTILQHSYNCLHFAFVMLNFAYVFIYLMEPFG